jgi:hypothetical protein
MENKDIKYNPIESHNSTIQVVNDSVFNNNKHFVFIYKKTERLVTAVYMITNFIKDNEPLKWGIRDNALDLMSLNLSFATVSLSERKELLRRYQANSVEIVSLCSIAYHAGLMSPMNYSVLKKEFESLLRTIEEGESKKLNDETIVLSKDFFETDINTPLSGTVKEVLFEGVSAENQVSNSSASFVKNNGAVNLVRPFIKKSVQPEKFQVVYKGQVKDKPEASPVVEKKNTRQDAILALLKKEEGVGIKDFAQVIKDCSEKTIQRELIEMLQVGSIRKEGDRRWSKYYLNS